MKGRAFTEQERQTLEDVISHRRAELGKNFISKEIPDDILERLFWAAMKAPSVGAVKPWEFVVIRDPAVKSQIKDCFEVENEKAKKIFSDKPLYQEFKLQGIMTTPVNVAVFYKPSTTPVLGQTSMPKTGLYSVCLAIQNLWLMARAENIGVCWVSLLDEERVKTILNAPPENELVAYLCLGYVTEFKARPELELKNWQKSKSKDEVIYYETYNGRSSQKELNLV